MKYWSLFYMFSALAASLLSIWLEEDLQFIAIMFAIFGVFFKIKD